MSVSEYLVVDSGGFIKNAPIKDYADNVVSLQSVVSEIVDKETKKRLQVLPYEIAFKEPSNEDLQHGESQGGFLFIVQWFLLQNGTAALFCQNQ